MWECRPSEVGEDWFSTYQAAGSPAPAQIIYSAEHTRKEPIINHCPSAPSRFPSIPTKPSPVKVSPCETKSNLGMPRVAFLYLLGFDGISFFSICLGGVWGAADPDACMREDCHMRAHVLHIHLMCLTFLLWLRIIWHRALVDDGNDLQWRHCYKNHVYYKWSSSWDILRMLPPVHSVSIHRSSQPWTPSLAWSNIIIIYIAKLQVHAIISHDLHSDSDQMSAVSRSPRRSGCASASAWSSLRMLAHPWYIQSHTWFIYFI